MKTSIELNLWFSQKSGNIYGNLNINHKLFVHIITKMLSLESFCDFVIKNNLLTTEELSIFVNLDDRDHDALYAWTQEGSIIWWNTKNSHASVVFNGNEYKVIQNKSLKKVPGSPDLCFRIIE